MTGEIAMGNHKVTGVATPTADTDAVNKKYVDEKAGGTYPYQVYSTSSINIHIENGIYCGINNDELGKQFSSAGMLAYISGSLNPYYALPVVIYNNTGKELSLHMSNYTFKFAYINNQGAIGYIEYGKHITLQPEELITIFAVYGNRK